MIWAMSPLAVAAPFHSSRCLSASAAMGRQQPQPLEPPRRKGLALLPAVAVFTTNLNGRLSITVADQGYGHTLKRESHVFPIFSQKQDGDYSRTQLAAQSGARSFVGSFLEKALAIFLRTQLDGCGDLSVAVGGSSWELLGGHMRRIEVNATKAIYKGIVISEVGLAACDVRAQIGKKRFFEHPFRVDANIRIQEKDFNSSLTSPLLSSSFKDILPRSTQPLQVEYDNGNLLFSNPYKQLSSTYGQVEYPIVLRVDVEKGGEVISVESSKSGSLKRKTFKVGPEVKITDFQVGNSWLSFTGEFLVMP